MYRNNLTRMFFFVVSLLLAAGCTLAIQPHAQAPSPAQDQCEAPCDGRVFTEVTIAHNIFSEELMDDSKVHDYFEANGIGVESGQLTIDGDKCILLYSGHGIVFRDSEGSIEFYRHEPDVAQICGDSNAETWVRFFAYGDVFVATSFPALPGGEVQILPPLVASQFDPSLMDNLQILAYFTSYGQKIEQGEYTIREDHCFIIYGRNGILLEDIGRATIEYYHYGPDVAKICSTDGYAAFGAYGNAVFVIGEVANNLMH